MIPDDKTPITIFVSKTDKEQVKQRAKEQRMNLSQFCRDSILKTAGVLN